MDAVDDIGIYNPSITVCFLAIILLLVLPLVNTEKLSLEKENLNTAQCHGFLCSSCRVLGLLHCTGAFGLGLLLSNSGLSLPPESAEALKYSVAYSFFTQV